MVAFHHFEHSLKLTEANVRGTKLYALPSATMALNHLPKLSHLCDRSQSSVWRMMPSGPLTWPVLLAVHVPVIARRSPWAAALWVKHFNEPHTSGVAALTVMLCDRKCSRPIMDPPMPVFCCSWTGESDTEVHWSSVLPRSQISSSYLPFNPGSISAHLGEKNPLVLHRKALICVLNMS